MSQVIYPRLKRALTDSRWGYEFASEGCMTIPETRKFMSVPRKLVLILIESGDLRSRHLNGVTFVCTKSVRNFMAEFGF